MPKAIHGESQIMRVSAIHPFPGHGVMLQNRSLAILIGSG